MLDKLLREQKPGMAKGSRLERVVQAPDAKAVSRELRHELGLRRGRSLWASAPHWRRRNP